MQSHGNLQTANCLGSQNPAPTEFVKVKEEAFDFNTEIDFKDEVDESSGHSAHEDVNGNFRFLLSCLNLQI